MLVPHRNNSIFCQKCNPEVDPVRLICDIGSMTCDSYIVGTEEPTKGKVTFLLLNNTPHFTDRKVAPGHNISMKMHDMKSDNNSENA